MKFDKELLTSLNEEYKKKPVKESFPQYDDDFQFLVAKKRINRITKLIDFNNKVVLEVGCGRGHYSRTLSDTYQCEVTGVDLYKYDNWSLLENQKVHFYEMDLSIGENSFETGSFDVIVSYAVFEHIEHPFSMLEELKRLIKPNGRIYIYANQYRSAIGSHLYRDIYFPYPHLLFQADVIYDYLGKNQGKYLLNKLTYSHYKNYFNNLGLEILFEKFYKRKIDEEFYERFGGILKMYPRFDLELDFFEVLLSPRKVQNKITKMFLLKRILSDTKLLLQKTFGQKLTHSIK